MAYITEAGHGVGIDARQLRKLARACRQAGKRQERQFKAGMLEVGETIAEEARARASRYSTRIPDQIRVRAFGATVEILAGTENDPLARLFELGNIKTGARVQDADPSGYFRHPLFGKQSYWVSQRMHPFLRPAAAFKQGVATEILLHNMNDVLANELEFHGFEVK